MLHLWSSVDADFCISSAYVTSGTKQSFCSENIRGQTEKTRKKNNVKVWPLNPYYKRSDWKTWLAERFSEALTYKFGNKKIHTAEAYWNGVKLNYIHSPPPPPPPPHTSPAHGMIKNLWQIHSRDHHMEFTGKNKVGNTTRAKLHGLIGQKWQISFQ